MPVYACVCVIQAACVQGQVVTLYTMQVYVCVCVLQFVIATAAAAAAVWEQQKICKIAHTPRVRVYFN